MNPDSRRSSASFVESDEEAHDNGDEEFVNPEAFRSRPRPSYAHSRTIVQDNQGYKITSKGVHKFRNYFNKNEWIRLDNNGHETFSKRKGRSGKITQKPAMDHIVQYAALDEHYTSRVHAERDKAARDLTRESSLDLHEAFKKAVADPTNLRLVSHAQHKKLGGSKRIGMFNQKEKDKARDLFEKHFASSDPNDLNYQAFKHLFGLSRPKSAVQLDEPPNTPTRRSSRLNKK